MSQIEEEYSEEMIGILAACSKSTSVCGRFIFSEHFDTEDSDLHRQIDELIDDDDKEKVAIAAPRGLGKTTRMSIGKCGQGILFGKYKFIVYVSHSFTAAQQQTNTLKRELLTNSFIKEYFGSIKPAKVEGYEEDFSKTAWVAENKVYGTKTYVLPRGYKQQIRGLKFGSVRPDLIIFDDLEETDTIHNPEMRRKMKDWFFADAMEAKDQREHVKCKFIYIDTLKHEDALLAHLLSLDSWDSLRLSICDNNYNSLAPGFQSTEHIKAKVEAAREAGTLDHFYREHMSEPISSESASFKTEYFKYYEEANESLSNNVDVENFVIVDPAKTATASSACSAIVGIGVNLRTNAIYVRDIIVDRLERHQVMELALDMCERLSARVLGVEITGLDQWIEQPFREEISRRHMAVHFVPLHAKKGKGGTELAYESGKVARVSGLVPYYRRGLIYHNKNVTGVLEAQLRSYPRAKQWDAMDALAYIIELLDYGERYFWPERASEPGYDIESEYAELEKDYAMPEIEMPDYDNYNWSNY